MPEQYNSNEGFYESRLSELARSLSPIGYDIENLGYRRNNLVIRILKEDGLKHNKECVEKDFRQSLDRCLASVKASYEFDVVYIERTNTVKIRRNDDPGSESFLTAFNRFILKREEVRR